MDQLEYEGTFKKGKMIKKQSTMVGSDLKFWE